MPTQKIEQKKKRQFRIRKKVTGTAERPRLCVFRSLNHVYAQIIDDTKGHTIASASTKDKETQVSGHRGNVAAAKAVGLMVGKRALEKGVKQVVFDRGGYKYHGRVKALADAAREAGLDF